jgi:phage shock protein A
MLHIAIQVRELATSNLNSLVLAASNPEKMLRLLRGRLQEALIALQGDLTRAERQAERRRAEAAQLAATVASWTDKARTAMDHKREDLARAALLAREDVQMSADRALADADALAAQARETAEVMQQLEAKLAETGERLRDEEFHRQSKPQPACPAPGATRAERILDGITSLEKRVDFATESRAQPAPASVDAEIETLVREAKVRDELAAMKAAAKPAAPRKGKSKAAR